MWRVLFLILFVPPALATYLPDATNRADWASTCGIVGGIPYRSTVYTNLPTSVSSSDINAAIVQCALTPGRIVQLTNGNYSFVDIVMKAGVELRGVGTNTRVQLTGAIRMGSELGDWVTTSISAGATRGSTSIVVSSASGLSAGMVLWISELNDPNYVSNCGFEIEASSPACSTTFDPPYNTGARVRQQAFRVLTVAGTTVEFYPPLETSFTLTPRAAFATTMSGCGVNNLLITNATTSSLLAYYAHDFYITNCVFDIGVGDSPQVQGQWTHRANIQHCTFRGYVGAASAIVPYVMNEGWKVENNIFEIGRAHV